MSDRSAIEWTDATWNPVTGCTKVSPGCDHCYAETFAERWRGTPGHYFADGFDVRLRPDKLGLPLRWRKPRRVFVNSMSDLFHTDVPDAFVARVFAVMALAPRHTFQVLTKRHGRMRSLLSSSRWPELVQAAFLALPDAPMPPDVYDPAFAWAMDPEHAGETLAPLPNVWLGVSVEDQQRADLRVPALLETPAAVRFLSCEPLLGHVDLRSWRWGDRCPGPQCGDSTWDHLCELGEQRLHWVIVGGESGRAARPMHPDWARTLRDQCVEAGVPFLFKQWGEWAPVREQITEVAHLDHDGSLFIEPRTFPAEVLRRLGKHRAGRELDGRTWDEFPQPKVQT